MGKELIVWVIHEGFDWVDEPFIKVNCAVILFEFIESELFGYEKGVFIGVIQF